MWDDGGAFRTILIRQVKAPLHWFPSIFIIHTHVDAADGIGKEYAGMFSR
jgi:hypothetical protein